MIEEGRGVMPAQRFSPGADQDGGRPPEVTARGRFGPGTIRGRLLISFVVVTLLSVAIVTVSAVVLGWQSGQQRAMNQLESVATLKEAEIRTWVDNLQSGLRTLLIDEEMTHRAISLVQGSPDAIDYDVVYGQLQGHFQGWMERSGQYEELFLLDLQGRVVLSTEPAEEDKFYSSQTFFRQGLEGDYVQPPLYSASLGKVSVIAAQPVVDLAGERVGVLAGRASPDTLNGIMRERAGLGETGETYLVGANHALLTPLRSNEQNIYLRTEGANAALLENVNGSGLYANYAGVPTLGVYHWVQELQVALLAEQEQAEALRSVRLVVLVNVGVAIGAVFLAAVASLFVMRGIANPMAELAETASRIAAGNLGLAARTDRRDEMGALARAFNSMTAQLRGMIDTLEQRVADRTSALEQRSAYLEASAEVARAASSILETDDLIRQVVGLIRERFGLYYVGLFELDAAREWAVRRAGTGQAGQALLERGHRLRIAGESMVGWSIVTGQARVAQVAEKDAIRLATPELPETRAEAALPLRSRGQVIGALSVQSAHPGTFDEPTITVLQTMADQVAVALDNARLFTETEKSLEAERRAYGQLSREAWLELLRAQPDLGFLSHARGTVSAGELWRPEMKAALKADHFVVDDESGRHLAIPLRVAGQVIGVVDGCKPDGSGGWTQEEIDLLSAMIEQLNVALEEARLYRDTQRRAARERLVGQITARMRETLDVETVLQTAIREMGATLGIARIQVRLGGAGAHPSDGREQAEEGNGYGEPN
jgi:GAF domain-containing protein/HAMP domain-containing protein